MIKAELKKVLGILDDSVKYEVPNYQRNFEWKKEQAEEFWEDISSGSVFLGNLVLDIQKEKENKILIVDGQQRITTIFIFLAACRYQAKKIHSHNQASVIQDKLSFVDATTGNAGSSKLIPSPSIADAFYETITNGDWEGKKFMMRGRKRQINKIKPIYEYFTECISKFGKDDLANILKKLYDSTFVKIEIEEPQEAFEIFERTNARGMELNAADLLKNYLFARNASAKLEEDWDAIVESSLGSILRMIKYYYVSNFGLIQKKLLFRALKKYGEEIGADFLIRDLKLFSYYYAVVASCSREVIIEWANESKNDYFRKEYNADSLNRALGALQLFGVTQAYPLIVKMMSVLSSFKAPDKNKMSEQFLSFLIALEKFHFINYAVAQRPGNQVEKYYADKCKGEINRKNYSVFIKEMTKELREEKVAGKAEFLEKFSELSYANTNDFYLIYYIFDRLNNFRKKGGQYISIYNPDKKLLRRNYDIEHLVAKNLDNYNFSAEAIGENIDNIGNLLVISRHTNGSVQNGSVAEKLEVFKDKEVQNLKEVQLLVKEWDSKKWEKADDAITNISERATALANRAYKEIWKI